MGCTDQKVRLINKKGAGIATVPSSADHRDGSWLSTDIYDGEWYLDTDTGFAYTRNGGAIIPLFVGVPQAGTVDTINIGDSTYTIGPVQTVFVNNTGGAVKLDLPSASGIGGTEFTIKKIDSSSNQFEITADGADLIDGSATLTSTTQFESFTLISDDGTNWFIK